MPVDKFHNININSSEIKKKGLQKCKRRICIRDINTFHVMLSIWDPDDDQFISLNHKLGHSTERLGKRYFQNN